MARTVKERLAHIKEQVSLIEQIDLALIPMADDLKEAKELITAAREKITKVLAGKTVYDTTEGTEDVRDSNGTTD
jgi:hypothetical protein